MNTDPAWAIRDAVKDKAMRKARPPAPNINVPEGTSLSDISNALKPLFPGTNRKQRRQMVKDAKRRIAKERGA